MYKYIYEFACKAFTLHVSGVQAVLNHAGIQSSVDIPLKLESEKRHK